MSTSDWRKAWRAKARQNTNRRQRAATEPTRTRTIVMAKPYCSPARDIVTGTFERYGVRLHGYREEVKSIGFRALMRSFGVKNFDEAFANTTLPLAQIAHITVSEAAAAWAEYLLLRTGKLYVPGQYVDKRNAAWANKHGGKMPTAWMSGTRPWLEPGCAAGHGAWRAAQNAVRR